jgi:hypothetical protein
MRYPQPRVGPETIETRLKAAKLYVDLTRTLKDIAYPPGAKSLRLDIETLLVVIAVFIGDGDDRPMTATKIAHFTELPRATVYRKLDQLIKLRKIVRVGRRYFYAENAMNPEPLDHLGAILKSF